MLSAFFCILVIIILYFKLKKMKENTKKLERAKEILKSAEKIKKKIQKIKKLR